MNAAALLLFLAAASDGPPETTFRSPEAGFNQLAENSRRSREEAFAEAQKAAVRAARGSYRPVRAQALGGADASTVIRRAQAALSTSPGEGIEAGMAVNIPAMLGMVSPHAVQVSVAELAGRRTRVGLGYGLNIVPTLADLPLPDCKLDLGSLNQEIEKARPSFLNVCAQVVSKLGDSAKARAAKGVCGQGPTVDGGVPLATAVEIVRQAAMEAESSEAHEQDLETLRAYREPRPDDCLANETIEEAFVRHQMSHAAHEFSLEGSITAFAALFGFQPDPNTPLSRGELAGWNAKTSYTLRLGYLDVSGALTAEFSRDVAADPLQGAIEPIFSLAYAIAPLSSTPLNAGRGVNLVEGGLPPRLVVGFNAGARIGMGAGGTAGELQRVDLTLYVDFRFTKDLATRLGVPLRAELLTSQVDGARGLQWSVPVFVTTILEIG